MGLLSDTRLMPADKAQRDLAMALYGEIKDLPIISPHGHTDPSWYALDEPFGNPAELFVTPDHYVTRMLVSHGVPLEDLGVRPRDDAGARSRDPRAIWRTFAERFYLFRATPSAMWIEHAFEALFGIETPLDAESADAIYDQINEQLGTPAFRPRALYERFNIEVIATTDGALDALEHHAALRDGAWGGRVVPTYRPDAVVDPEAPTFAENVARLGDLTGEDIAPWDGYLRAHRARRAEFKALGATATDHGHPSARTEDLDKAAAERLYDGALKGVLTPDEADAFRGQMLTEMARMSIEDGLVMQIHAGSTRNHNQATFERYGPDKGFDIPKRANFVDGLRPLLNAVGLEPNLRIILFTLDETTYARELAPLAGVYPSLKLGPAWWFYDSYEGMLRYREMTTETAGFYNTVGFNDDTRAFCSIPARHDVARRVDCAYLAGLVRTGRLREGEAHEVAYDLAYRLAKDAYQL